MALSTTSSSTPASTRVNSDHAGSVVDHDEIHDHILGMATVLGNGLIRAFADRLH